MKKFILVIAVAGVAISCKKIQAGGNLGRLKLEEGTERYSDIEIGSEESHHEKNAETAVSDSLEKTIDTAKVVKTEENH